MKHDHIFDELAQASGRPARTCGDPSALLPSMWQASCSWALLLA